PLVPLLMLYRIIIFSAVGLVDGIFSLFFRWNLPAPFANIPGQIHGPRRLLCPLTSRVVFIGFHATRRRVYDEYAPAPGVLENLVHARTHLFRPAHRIQAVMSVPHVAYDDGRFTRVPLLGLLAHRICAAGRRLAEALVNRDLGSSTRLGPDEVARDG